MILLESLKWLGTGLLLAGLCGCIIVCNDGSGGCQASFNLKSSQTRQDSLSAPFAAGETLDIEIQNGTIEVTGGTGEGCQIEATVKVWGQTDEKAREWLDGTTLTLTPAGDALQVRVERPDTKEPYGVRTDLKIVLPRESNHRIKATNDDITLSGITGWVTVETQNGAVRISEVTGAVKVTGYNGDVRLETITGASEISVQNGRIDLVGQAGNARLKGYNGAVTVERLTGDLRVDTQNGQIEAREVSGKLDLTNYNQSILVSGIRDDIQAKTQNGRIDVAYEPTARGDCSVHLEGYNGAIAVRLPDAFAGKVEMSSYNGKIKTDRPVAVQGELGGRSNKIAGQLGDSTGTGKLEVKTQNGAITLR